MPDDHPAHWDADLSLDWTIPETGPGPGKHFAHPSERFLAHMLDLCRLRWAYEPRTFVLRKDEHGRVSEGFTPDFYLPDLDLYLEVTTQRQGLVTRKHRKVRRLHNLYPHIRLHLLHRRDCLQLRSLVAHGRIAPAQVATALEIALGQPPAPPVVARASYRTRLHRVVDAGGFIRLHGQRVFVHSGLPNQRVTIWVYSTGIEIAHASKVVARYQCHYDPQSRHVQQLTHPRHYVARLTYQRRLPAFPRPLSPVRKVERHEHESHLAMSHPASGILPAPGLPASIQQLSLLWPETESLSS